VTSRVDDGHRRLVPRWRYADRTIIGCEHAGDPRDRANPPPRVEAIEPLVTAWADAPSHASATDLVCAAIVLARPDLAVAASEWLLRPGSSVPRELQAAARTILLPGDAANAKSAAGHNLWAGREHAQAVVALSRQRLAEAPRSVLRWLDVSLAHTVLGTRDKALAAMRIALSLEPNHRIVLRAAVRSLVHVGRADEAYELLRRHSRTAIDPWLLSQDVSVAHIVGHTAHYLDSALRVLRSTASLSTISRDRRSSRWISPSARARASARPLR